MQALDRFDIPDRVTAITGMGGLPAILVRTPWSQAEIYPHGAHVTRFQKTDEEPLLFMSAASEFSSDRPIRGGVPVIFPWFGPREGQPAHGIARTTTWELLETATLPDGSIKLRLRLPAAGPYDVHYIVTVGPTLTLELAITNTGNEVFTFENCLHTYFQVGDVSQISITGLAGIRYRDVLLDADFTEGADPIRIATEVDRTYQDTMATVDVHDPDLRRTIHVRKSGSRSTVVWNPWIAKSIRMPDFGDLEYPNMVCVESGNIGPNAITLKPGESSSLVVELASSALA